MNRPARIALPLLVVVLLAIALATLRPLPGEVAGTTAATETAAFPATVSPMPALAAFAGRAPGPLPPSLADTRPPSLTLDANGNLVVNLEVRDLFEYFLSALGEEDIDAVSARLAAWLQATLPPAAAARAWEIFGTYLEYRAAQGNMNEQATDNPDELLTRLDRMSALRRDSLGAEVADAFFRTEEAYDRDALQRLQLARNGTLTPEARARRLAQLDSALPPELLAARRESTSIEEMSRTVDLMRSNGASDAEIQATRERLLGVGAAQRLADLDGEHAEWNQRYRDYATQRDAIQAASLADSDRALAIQALRLRLFSAQEAIRVDALDRIAAGAAK